jgi:glycosyltransferase involved in cell wall biosynthesis
MRIGIDIRPLLESQPTGVGEYTREVVRHLLQLYPDDVFHLYASSAKPRPLPEIGVKDHPHAIVKWLYKPNKWINATTTLSGRPKLDAILGGVDVFFSPNVNFTALQSSCPHVITMHDVSFALFPQFFSARRRLWHSAVRVPRLVKNAAHIICDSRSTSEDVQQLYGVASEQLSVIPLGVSENFKEVTDLQERARIKKEHELPDNYILTLGSIEPRKNLVSLITAFDHFCETSKEAFSLVVAGPRGWKSGAFWSALRRSPFADRIHVLGFVPEKDRPGLISMAKCVVSASSYEGFGLPVLEAMRCGVPVITSHTSSLPEVLHDAGILVDPERPLQISRALQALLSDKVLQEQFREKGLARSRQFSWEKTAEATYAVLKKVVHQRIASTVAPALEKMEVV